YKDLAGRRREATDDALLAVLRALGEPVESMRDVRSALERAASKPQAEPVRVAWGGKLSDPPEGRVELEDGGVAEPSDPLPFGYHRVHAKDATTLVVSAPERCYEGVRGRTWGVFLPLYALRTARDWGCGDLSDLTALLEWTQGLGGSVVGTLPMLAAFLDDPFERSPYSPFSRMFWNELYVD